MDITEDLRWHAPPAPVPEIGKKRVVWLPAEAVHGNADSTLLWVPPFSEENGWAARPSELAESCVLTAHVVRTGTPPAGDRVECVVDITHRVGLIETCSGVSNDTSGNSALLASLLSPVFWDQVRWSGTAVRGGLTFLEVTAGDTTLAMLLNLEADDCSVRYAQLQVGDCSAAALGCWTLEGALRLSVERIVCTAVALEDITPLAS